MDSGHADSKPDLMGIFCRDSVETIFVHPISWVGPNTMFGSGIASALFGSRKDTGQLCVSVLLARLLCYSIARD